MTRLTLKVFIFTRLEETYPALTLVHIYPFWYTVLWEGGGRYNSSGFH